ncbi:hypothetical protein [Robertmurraya andreesenii]|uniref:Phage protein n=1 Tax=Anoxybacillus andreesenii TaxID=1325932 RepID=A0ABT9V1U9_9BACL|nr:hypothetical protein [Robertmurraya andreesenii]MDQ0154929.1 hypothetical protein [Robertmurraya andreesenii]
MNYLEAARKIYEEGYRFAGVRSLTDDENYNIGDTCRQSYEWDREEDCSTYYTTGLKAGGTCAIEVRTDYLDNDTVEEDIKELAERIEKAVVATDLYMGFTKAIIAGNSTYTDLDWSDDNEIRIVDAVVIELI